MSIRSYEVKGLSHWKRILDSHSYQAVFQPPGSFTANGTQKTKIEGISCSPTPKFLEKKGSTEKSYQTSAVAKLRRHTEREPLPSNESLHSVPKSPGTSHSECNKSSDCRHCDSNLRRSGLVLRSKRSFKGPLFLGLTEFRPINVSYVDVLSYRFHRLDITSQTTACPSTGMVRYYIKRTQMKRTDHIFLGRDAINILEFLSRFWREANIEAMLDAYSFLPLSFLHNFACSQWEKSMKLVSAEEGGITAGLRPSNIYSLSMPKIDTSVEQQET